MSKAFTREGLVNRLKVMSPESRRHALDKAIRENIRQTRVTRPTPGSVKIRWGLDLLQGSEAVRMEFAPSQPAAPEHPAPRPGLLGRLFGKRD
jgi:hypothetical protein